jgi:hypothetical protein
VKKGENTPIQLGPLERANLNHSEGGKEGGKAGGKAGRREGRKEELIPREKVLLGRLKSFS